LVEHSSPKRGVAGSSPAWPAIYNRGITPMAMIETSKTFLKESVQELRKVQRPGRKEIIASTIVVLVVTLLFMSITLIEDQIIGWLISLLYN
jgi:preprotein translocase SecE subunit